MTEPSISILIVSFNSAWIIERTIEALFRAIDLIQEPAEVLIWDNASTDDTVERINRFGDKITLHRSDSNLGFGEGNNILADKARGETLILLNDDMVVDPNFLKTLKPYYDRPDFFAVTGLIYGKDKSEIYESYVTLSYRRGRLRFSRKGMDISACPADENGHLLSAQATGGGSAFNRKRFLQLGGFDPLYRPCYWEDTDLSYCAWRRGWKIYYEPSAIVYHIRDDRRRLGSTAWEKQKRLIDRCNRYLFMWKNLIDRRYLFLHILTLPLHLTGEIIKGHLWTFTALIKAVASLRKILKRRRKEINESIRNDKEITRLLSSRRVK